MSDFCYETHLIEALQKFAAAELTREQAAKLNILIENNTDPRATVAVDGPAPFQGAPKTGAPDVDPEAQERAFRFLKTRGFTEDDITHLRGLYGMETDPAKRAMDAAIRKTDQLSRAASDYARRFPEAGHIKLG